MAVEKKSLEHDLNTLLGNTVVQMAQETRLASNRYELQELAVENIYPGRYQPRTDMNPAALEELALSIRAQGVMQPVVVRALDSDRFELIAGERRWRACRIAGLKKIPAVIREVSNETAMAMALIENIQREDLSAIEEAQALQHLQQEYQLTQQQVADAVGKSRVAVTNLLRLIGLPEEVKTLLARGDLNMGHARALLGLPCGRQVECARHIVAHGLTVRQAERLVRQWLNGRNTHSEKLPVDPDITCLERRLAERLGSPVQIHHGKKGKGQLVIHYGSLDELQGVLAHIQ